MAQLSGSALRECVRVSAVDRFCRTTVVFSNSVKGFLRFHP